MATNRRASSADSSSDFHLAPLDFRRRRRPHTDVLNCWIACPHFADLPPMFRQEAFLASTSEGMGPRQRGLLRWVVCSVAYHVHADSGRGAFGCARQRGSARVVAGVAGIIVRLFPANPGDATYRAR